MRHGCHGAEPCTRVHRRKQQACFPFLWIAANELPLEEPLIPFLIARTGRALDELTRWIVGRRPADWLRSVLRLLPMSQNAYEAFERLLEMPPDTPLMAERWRMALEHDLARSPEVREKIVAEARLAEVRADLRDVLDVRGLSLDAADSARIDACTDLAQIKRWLKLAVVAKTAAEALRD